MTAIKVSFNETAIESVKKAVGGMRQVFTDNTETNEAGESVVTKTALDKAKAAFAAASAIAKAEGVMALSQTDEQLTAPGMQPVVAIVGARERNEKTGKMDSGFRAIVMFGMPDANAFISYVDSDGKPTGSQWVEKLVEKEAAHVFFRPLRTADDAEGLAAAFESDCPRDVDMFVKQYVGEGLDTDAFDAVWPGFRKLLNAKLPALVKLLPAKGEVLKAIRSKPYAMAEAELSPLEAQGIFVFIASSMIKAGQAATNDAGEPSPIDMSTLESWLAERETFTYREAPKAEKDFSVLSGLNLGILAAPATATQDAPTTDAPAVEGTTDSTEQPQADAPTTDAPASTTASRKAK